VRRAGRIVQAAPALAQDVAVSTAHLEMMPQSDPLTGRFLAFQRSENNCNPVNENGDTEYN
jgi:hypothetical protein